MSKSASKKKGLEAKAAEHAEKSRNAMQRASSVRALRQAVPSDAASQKGRKDRKGVVVYLPVEAKDQLARLAFEERKTVQALGVEAINLLFEAYRLKPIA